MNRRIKVIIFFLIVFVLPIGWYLFLQFFGRNNFALDSFGPYSIESCKFEGPVLITRDDLITLHPNQFDQISRKLNSLQDIGFYGIDSSCMLGFDMILIDQEMMIRGQYVASREDVDRMLAEVDIYLLGLNEDGIKEGE